MGLIGGKQYPISLILLLVGIFPTNIPFPNMEFSNTPNNFLHPKIPKYPIFPTSNPQYSKIERANN